MSIIKAKRKSNKKYIFILLTIILLLFATIWVIPSIIISGKDEFTIQKALGDYNTESTELSLLKYNIGDLYEVLLVEEEQKNYILEIRNNIIYENIFPLNVKIENYDENSSYKIDIFLNNELILQKNIENSQEEIKLSIENEGKQDLQVDFYKNEEKTNSEIREIYYIEPYNTQFLDELSNNSIMVHYRDGSFENYNKSIPLLSTLGVQVIRMDFFYAYIYKNGSYNFDRYDEWIEILKDKNPNIRIVAVIQPASSFTGSDRKINSDEEIEYYIEFCKAIVEHYPEMTYLEILNEPNFLYITDDDLYWYRRMLEQASIALKELNQDIKIISGTVSAGTQDTPTFLSSKTFFDKMYSDTIYTLSETFAYNVYTSLPEKLVAHKEQFNGYGGFLKQYITEYGASSYNNITYEEQAIELIKQTNCLKQYGVFYSNIYNFWDTGTDKTSKTQNHGLLYNDYTPKPAYYAMKNYYENTNGAEYIGTINLADELEAHVYDKDGKTKIITWATNTTNTAKISYQGFTASDIYGNEIENTDGTLAITSSPVYLDDVSNEYFYQAISNTATEKYTEFEEKFAEQIEKIEGFSEKITELKTYMINIADNEAETQANALKQMSEHFALGDTLLNAYENEILDIEYVTLSSMLDMLNDIGDSYEDLVTVSATTREGYFEATNNLIQEAENKINNNSDLEIIYPVKILDFAKELDKKAEYILSLEEENDIKTGLIVSNSLHAYYLANWANRFAQLYINDDIKNNPVTISYSETELTNQNVTATLIVPQGTTITNNEGKNTYVFEQNDQFTFEYERRGQAFTIDAQVSNIDKDAPSIRGVIDGKIYISDVSFWVNDNNLEKVEVTFNDSLIEYTNWQQLSEEGIYHITATDKAGNITELEFYIVEEVTDDYIIKDSYLLNIKQNTNMADFIAKFGINGDYQIIRNNETLEENNIVATGDILELENGQQYTIIVAGDINNDGKVTPYDYTALRRTILRLRELNEIEALAADINLDNREIGVNDYTRMRIELLGEY